jgi:hypothetical protein
MTSAGEVFVVELARASKRANRFVRHLPSEDRKDVIGAAIAWCWENRASYSLTTTLDTWFMNAVRDAYKAWARGENRNGSELLAEIPTGDTTLATVEAWESALKLSKALPPVYRKIAQLHAQGYTRAEINDRGFSKRDIDESRERIRQLRKLVPDDHEYRRVLRTAPTQGSDDVSGELSEIDVQLEQLDWTPSVSAGKDCPPCWRCKWFEGYMPGKRKAVQMPIVEPVVAEAVRNTEREKIRIAKEVRDGNL